MDILIIDDHPLFSSGLIELIKVTNENLSLSSCTSFEDAKPMLGQGDVRLVLLDLDLGEECGVDISIDIVEMYPNSRVAILSGNENIETMRQCVLNGVVGYIKKSSSPETLIQAINLLLADGSYFPANLLPYLLNANSESAQEAVRKVEGDEVQLTARQNEVLLLLRKGLSNKAMAYQMGISEGTVKLHVSTVLNKLGVSNRSEAIIKTN